MGLTPATWLIDKSALARAHITAVGVILRPRVQAGQVAVSILTELEVGYSARSTTDYQAQRSSLLDHLLPVLLPVRAEQRAREVQAQLVERGQHRAVAVPDLLIAATAELEGLTVLHYDRDFNLISDITGQPTEWIVDAGTVS